MPTTEEKACPDQSRLLTTTSPYKPGWSAAKSGIHAAPAPDCAEPVIGRRFAPTRWLHPGYATTPPARTAKSCGLDAPTLASSSRSGVGQTGLRQNISAGDGGKRVRSPGTRGRGCNGHPAFPTPSLGRKIHQRLGRIARRGRALAFRRHCEQSEAIHLTA